MKRIINGRLWDDQFMNEIGSKSFSKDDPVTGETVDYRETLLREYVLKPGHTPDDTWVEDPCGARRIVKDNCDLTRGQFVLRVRRGWGDGIFVPIGDAAARKWFEDHMPDDVELYAEIFGTPSNPWSGDGAVALVERLESKLRSADWDRERAEARAARAESEVAGLKVKLEALSKPAEPPVPRESEGL